MTELARDLGMTQPQASKHLRVLREVGLVRVRGAGKQRLYGLDARGLRPVHEWVGGFERFWNESFDRLDEYVQELKQARQEKDDGSDSTRRAGAVSDGGPRDRDLPGHRRPTGAGVRGVHAKSGTCRDGGDRRGSRPRRGPSSSASAGSGTS